MRTFLLFVALMGGSLLLAAVLAYPAWLAVSLVSLEPIHRVMERIAMLFALIGLVAFIRHRKLGNREALGYALPRPQFLQQMALGFATGLLLMIPLVILLFGLGIRQLKPEFVWQVPALLAIVGQGLLTGLTVAFIEETFFRGAMQTVITREAGPRLAILLPSLLYACVHFLGGKLRLAPEHLHWSSGFTVLANLFERYATPLALVDSLAALVAIGVLLGMVRLRTGSIAGCIGLHAGWVCVIVSVRSASTLERGGWSWLVGSYDGVIGWAAFGLTTLIIAAYHGLDKPAMARWRLAAEIRE